MKTHLRTPLIALSIAGAMAVAAPAMAQGRFDFNIGVGPRYEAPRYERYGSAWVPGHWEWRYGQREWIPGHYAVPVRHYDRYWVPGHWVGFGYERHYVPGHYEY